MKEVIKLVLIMSTTLLIGCQKENEKFIEEELLVYFEKFENEAFQREIEISLEDIDLSGYITNIKDRGVLGTCTTFTNGSNTITIDQPYWDSANELQKEYLVFHELGHCVLDREHDNSRLTNGDCKSIMQSGTGGCKTSYNQANRDLLIDELFTY